MYEEYLLIAILIVLLYFVSKTISIERKIFVLSKLWSSSSKESIIKLELKNRKRYVVLQIISEEPLSDIEELNSLFMSALKNCLGEITFAECKPHIVYYNSKRKRLVLRSYNQCIDKIIACLGSLRVYENKKMLIIPIRTTGTLKKARWYLFDKHRAR